MLFLDECDALCPKRDPARPQESRVTAQLLSLLDGLRHQTSGALHQLPLSSTMASASARWTGLRYALCRMTCREHHWGIYRTMLGLKGLPQTDHKMCTQSKVCVQQARGAWQWWRPQTGRVLWMLHSDALVG